MKKFLNLLLVIIPMGIYAQGPQTYYAYADRADAVEETIAVFGFEVNDLLLADPDFDIQEEMVSYTKDGKKVFFSAHKKLKPMNDNEETKIKNSSRIHLFKADVTESGAWVNLEMLPFNGSNYSTGHPALNRDDSKLYFASDGPGSTGKTDIFKVELFENGTYGEPENLGSKINSEEREVFPYVDAENVLYFASDAENEGKFLEAYASAVVNGTPSTPVKLDVAVNSPREELIASYKTLYAETFRQEEADADLMDLEILTEAEKEATADLMDLEILTEAEKEAGLVAEKEAAEMAEKEMAARATNSYNFNSDRIVFTVQVGAFIKSVNSGTHTQYADLFYHQYPDGLTRYFSGVFDSEEEARSHVLRMRKKGFTDAFVLSLQGEKRVIDR